MFLHLLSILPDRTGGTATGTAQVHVSSETKDQDTQDEKKVATTNQRGQLEFIETQGESGRSACSENQTERND